jgi:hypothetical protein
MTIYKLRYVETIFNYYEVEGESEDDAIAKVDEKGIWDVGTLVETECCDEVFEEIEEMGL